MSEYQYYEFQTIDRPLDNAAQRALRSISTRARITGTSFTNTYEWGDLKGDPRKFMEQWFDLHLYVANWGTRRLMMRAPRRLLNHKDIKPFLREVDWAQVWVAGDNVIVDLCRDEVDEGDEWDDGTGWLGALAPLRGDVLSGDLRLFYLLWLAAVQDDLIGDDETEPLPGIGPMTGALEAFADFFAIDPDLVQAAAESTRDDAVDSKNDLRKALASIADDEKTEYLARISEGDKYAVAELKRTVAARSPAPGAPRRTAGSLRAQAQALADARERADRKRREAEQRRKAEAAERARRARLQSLKQRGEAVWREIEAEIDRRNPSGYDKAANLLSDLQALAAEDGGQDAFVRRLASIRTRHEQKKKLIERLTTLGYASD